MSCFVLSWFKPSLNEVWGPAEVWRNDNNILQFFGSLPSFRIHALVTVWPALWTLISVHALVRKSVVTMVTSVTITMETTRGINTLLLTLCSSHQAFVFIWKRNSFIRWPSTQKKKLDIHRNWNKFPGTNLASEFPTSSRTLSDLKSEGNLVNTLTSVICWTFRAGL